MLQILKKFIFAGLIITSIVYMVGCASPTHDLRIDYDKSVDFYSYETYGFVSKLGTDHEGYSTLATKHFKQEVSREMEGLGYTFSETNPDLLVNFSMYVESKTDVETFQNATMPVSGYYGGYYGGRGGYYGYRRGLYNTYPRYDTDVRVVNYKEGTVNIDVVDAKNSQLIWEALVEGRLSKKSMKNPEDTISKIVTELFKRYPPKEN